MTNILRFLLSLSCVFSLSLIKSVYQTSKLPQTDLKVINAQQTNIIKSQWYNKLMEDIELQQKDSWENCKDPLAWANNQKKTIDSNPILKHINKLETYFQTLITNHLFKLSSFASMAAVVPLTVLSSIRYCSRSYSHGLACSVLGFSAFILLMASTALQTRFTKK